MKTEIVSQPLVLEVYGFGDTAPDKNYSGKAFSLMDRMWQIVRSNGIKNHGKNVWIYEPGDRIFAGVQLEEEGEVASLERKKVSLPRYARCTHVGPYKRIPSTGNAMRAEIKGMGLVPGLPYIEIYGHWTSDESTLETELLIAIVN